MAQNIALPADQIEPAVQIGGGDELAPAVVVPTGPTFMSLSPSDVQQMGTELQRLFTKYKSDRFVAEQKWLRNQRQYLGIYDPEIEETLSENRSRAYPRITRVKCIAMLSRIMNLMFPGNDRNWDLNASPSAQMHPEHVQQALMEYLQKRESAGAQIDSQSLTDEDLQNAVQMLADKRADALQKIIDDQLQELGGDQTYDYVQLNRHMIMSGIMYGFGVLVGPYVRVENMNVWSFDQFQQPVPSTQTIYKPMFEWLPVWDFYPDMSAKKLDADSMDGWFRRYVMSRSQLRDLARRDDFNKKIIDAYLDSHQQGNYKPLLHETHLRVMGVKVNVNEQSPDGNKYEVLVWNGKWDATKLKNIGVEIPPEAEGDIECELWMIDNYIIKADVNMWRKMGKDVKTLHVFVFDEDDTSPLGNGLPNVIRDSQMSICAATRMLMDNASIVCGPILEINRKLLQMDKDTKSIHAYKIFERDDDDPLTVQWPAVREIKIDSHISELEAIIKTFMEFADTETFIGPLGMGDNGRMPSEPMRTAAGASMLRGDASLPIKDVIRNFDTTTQSIIYSLVQFNSVYRPGQETEGDFNVIARGATSLISKEVRGMQMDQLAQTLTDEEKLEIDNRKLLRERLATRDAEGLMLSETDAAIQKDQRNRSQQEQQELMRKQVEAEIRKSLSDSFKNITQGQKNQAAADANNAQIVLDMLERALSGGETEQGASNKEASSAGGE